MITKGRQLTVLLLEDSEADAEMINEMLTGLEEADQQFSVIIYHAKSIQEMREVLAHSYRIDVALIDLGLPDSAGLATYRKVRDELLDTPIVIMSGNQDEELIVDLLRFGAQDYLPKNDINIESSRLVLRTLVFAIERAELMVQLRSQQAAADLASISGVLKEACRVPCQKLELAIKTGYDRRNRANLDRMLREAYASSQAIAHTFESIFAASTRPQSYDAMAVVRDFAEEHQLSLDDARPVGTVTGCPHSLWAALEFLLSHFESDRKAPTLVAENEGSSLKLELRAGDSILDEESVYHFAPVSLDHATLRDLPVVYSSRLHGGICEHDRRNRASRMSLPLASSALEILEA